MKSFGQLACTVVVAAVLSACGGGDGGTATVETVPAGTAIAMNATTGAAVVQALAGKTFTFASAPAEFGITGETTLKLDAGAGGSTFSLGNGGNTASGNLNFGSCLFVITASTFTSGPLALGKTVTVATCNIAPTTSIAAGTGATPTPMAFTLGNAVSTPIPVTVAVAPGGVVTLTTPSGAAIVLPVTLPTRTVSGGG